MSTEHIEASRNEEESDRQSLTMGDIPCILWMDKKTKREYLVRLVPSGAFIEDWGEEREPYSKIPASRGEWTLQAANVCGEWCGDLEPISILSNNAPDAVDATHKLLDANVLDFANFVRQIGNSSERCFVRLTGPSGPTQDALWVTFETMCAHTPVNSTKTWDQLIRQHPHQKIKKPRE